MRVCMHACALATACRSATFEVAFLDRQLRVTRGDRGELRIYVRDDDDALTPGGGGSGGEGGSARQDPWLWEEIEAY